MKRIFGSIPITAAIVLLFLAMFGTQATHAQVVTLSLAADTYDSSERLRWARVGSEITVTVVDPAGDTTGGADTVTVSVESDEGDDDETVTLTETGGSTDTFTGVFDVVDEGATSSDPFIEVDGADDEVTVVYGSLVRRFNIEDEEPDIDVVDPEHEDVVDDSIVEFEVEITDSDSGFTDPDDMNQTNVVFLVSDVQCGSDDGDLGTGSEGLLQVLDDTTALTMDELIDDIELIDCNGASGADIDVVIPPDDDFDEDDGDLELTFDLSLAPLPASGIRYIGLAAVDDAGNFQILDIDRSDDEVTLLELTVDEDPPDLVVARTGVAWDSLDDEYDRNERDFIQLVFDDITDLDPDSIDSDDFVVEGHSVRAARWFDVDPDEVTGFEDFDGTSFVCTVIGDLADDEPCDDDDDGDLDDGLEIVHPLSGGADINRFAFIARTIFLQLEDELDPDETPDVTIVPDGVDDEAGNDQDDDEIDDTDDRIAPEFTVEEFVCPTGELLAGEDDECELVIRADEELDDDPTVTATLVIREPGDDIDDTTAGPTIGTEVDEIGNNRWRVTIDEPNNTGYYSIFVTGVDDEDNEGDIGIDPANLPLDADDLDDEDQFWKNNGDVNDDDAIFFEGDREMPDPLVRVAGEIGSEDPEVEFRNPFFIEINFERNEDDTGGFPSENSEYAEDNFDDVEITLFELDGVDLTDTVTTTNDRVFLVGIENISIDEHEVRIQAEDQAGNELDDILEIDFEVEERDPFELEVQPGWNLVSVSGQPSDPSIDAVLPPGTPVTTVYSFDPTVPGGWLVAVRETEDDPWIGDLTEINANRGYWFQADQITQIDIDVPRIAGGAINGGTPIQPPTIDLFPGWNLVPVLDTSGEIGDNNFGDPIDIDNYFASVNEEVTRVLTYDTITNAWDTIQFLEDGIDEDSDGDITNDGPELFFGDAYWVFVTEEVTLIP